MKVNVLQLTFDDWMMVINLLIVYTSWNFYLFIIIIIILLAIVFLFSLLFLLLLSASQKYLGYSLKSSLTAQEKHGFLKGHNLRKEKSPFEIKKQNKT